MNETTGTIPTPPTLPQATRPPLRRSRTDRVLGGVAGGFARWLGIDPVIVRVVIVVLAVFGGSGLLLYALGWLFIPDEGEPKSEAEKLLDRTREPNSTGRTVLIVAAVLVGLIVLGGIASAGPWSGAWGGPGWLLLLAVGGLVLWLVNRPPTGTATWVQPTAPSTPTDRGPVPTSDTVVIASLDDEAAPTVVAAADSAPDTAGYDTTGYAYGGYGGYPGYVAPVPAPTPPPAPRQRSYLGLATLSVSVITMGVLGILAMSGAVGIPAVVVLAAGLGVLGLGLLVGAFVGRARWLIALALPLLLVTALISLIPSNLALKVRGGIGERTWTPTRMVDVADPYRLGVGSAALDLTALALPTDPAAVIPIHASVGVGELLVTVPEGVNVVVTATAGLGEISIEGTPKKSGQDRRLTADVAGLIDESSPTIQLTTDVAIGNVEVSRA
jgi:phage shock protein PspC (stress-responsive transcriptional regulator)